MERESQTSYRQEWLMPPVLMVAEQALSGKNATQAFVATMENGTSVASLEYRREWKALTWETPSTLGHPEELLRSLKDIIAPKEKSVTAAIQYLDERGRTLHSLSLIGRKSNKDHKKAMHDVSRIKEIQYHSDSFRLIINNPAHNEGEGTIRLKTNVDAPYSPAVIDWVFANHNLSDSLSSIDTKSAASALSQLK